MNLAKGTRRAAAHGEAVAYEVAFDTVRIADQYTRRNQAANWKVSEHVKFTVHKCMQPCFTQFLQGKSNVQNFIGDAHLRRMGLLQR